MYLTLALYYNSEKARIWTRAITSLHQCNAVEIKRLFFLPSVSAHCTTSLQNSTKTLNNLGKERWRHKYRMESVFAILIKSLFSLISLNIWESPKATHKQFLHPLFSLITQCRRLEWCTERIKFIIFKPPASQRRYLILGNLRIKLDN